MRERTRRSAPRAALPEHNPLPVLEASRDGDLLYANPAAREELSIEQLTSKEPHPLLQGLAAMEPVQGGELACRRVELDGRVFEERICYEPASERYLIYLLDITDQHHANQDLKEHAEALASTNEELERFAFVAAHDLREPLRAIQTFSQKLDQRYADTLDQDGQEALGFLQEAASRLDEVVKGLQNYSVAGREGEAFEAVELNRLVDTLSARLQAQANAAGATVSRDELPRVRIDRDQIGLVLHHLMSNALKFLEGPGPHFVHVGARRDSHHWVISVSDTGIGIAPRHHERIFEMFRRLHPPHRFAGSGVGLSICKRIVERHNGEIWVTSEEGGGSTFHFSLPTTLPEEPHPEGAVSGT